MHVYIYIYIYVYIYIVPLRVLSPEIGALDKLQSLWLEELTIPSLLLKMARLLEHREFSMHLCIFCRSLPVQVLTSIVSLATLVIEWTPCPHTFATWYVNAGCSRTATTSWACGVWLGAVATRRRRP